jgi:uncharacterized protein YkwD
MKKLIKIFVFLFITFISISPSFSETWDGGGSDNLASTPANWTGNVIPPDGVNIIFDNTSSKSCTWDLNQTYKSLTIGSGYTGTVTINSTLILASNYSSAGGVPVSGYPNWQERAVLVVTNAVRQAPQAYRATYTSFTNILLPANYPAVAPLYWNESLNHAARAHAVDMATTPCFQHNSCDGTIWSDRIRSYYPSATFLAENIAAGTGLTSPKAAVELLICDYVPELGNCATDKTTGDGHRQNIMNAHAKELGNGYYYYSSSPYDYYWVQDFGATTLLIFQPPIVSGAHMAINGQLTFWLNYYAPAAPQAVRLVINGSPTTMMLAIGSAQSGLYIATAAADSVCRSYHFEAVDSSGQGWRYPGTGEFRTYGINSCTEDYTSSMP